MQARWRRAASRPHAVVGSLLLSALCWPGPAPAAVGTVSSASPFIGQDAPRDTVENLEELAAQATAAVVFIEVETAGASRQGSGFLIDPNGLVLTNHHVIRDAKTARVRLASGDVYDRVVVLAVDERRDIAALRIPGFALPALELGNSDSVRIGAAAIAIGSPLGLENTVSTGIVSGRRQEPEGYQLLQITAPASSGSSGGPVLARDGRVIGIAATQIRNGQNLNFAVPINYARGLLSQIDDGEPLAVLAPEGVAARPETYDMAAAGNRVNRGLSFDLEAFRDHRLDLEAREVAGSVRRTRVTYRRIEDIAGGPPRIERYLESETSAERGTLGPPLATRRQRVRTIVSASDLSPISSRGQVDWVVDGQWRQISYELRFDERQVRGTIQDSSGVVAQIDRELPEGILLRDARDLAFGTLAADGLMGRSLELVTFDPWTGKITSDRYDVRGETALEIHGEEREALIVDLASGLTNERVYFTRSLPRLLLKRVRAEDGAEESVVGLYWLPTPENPDEG